MEPPQDPRDLAGNALMHAERAAREVEMFGRRLAGALELDTGRAKRELVRIHKILDDTIAAVTYLAVAVQAQQEPIIPPSEN